MMHLLMLPGVLLHELSHFLVGLILWAKPVKFSIIPNKANNSAGEVHFKNIRFFNAFPIAIAPIFGGVAGVFGVYEYYFSIENELLYKFGYFYLMTVFIQSALPSKQDFKVAFSYPIGALIYLLIIFFLLEFYNVINFINLDIITWKNLI